MIGFAVLFSHAVAAVIVMLWGMEYGVKIGDTRGILGYSLGAATLCAGIIWAVALSV